MVSVLSTTKTQETRIERRKGRVKEEKTLDYTSVSKGSGGREMRRGRNVDTINFTQSKRKRRTKGRGRRHKA